MHMNIWCSSKLKQIAMVALIIFNTAFWGKGPLLYHDRENRPQIYHDQFFKIIYLPYQVLAVLEGKAYVMANDAKRYD